MTMAACQSSSGLDSNCAAAATISQISTDLPQELAELKAAGPGVPIYGMNYYDPFLASWLTGAGGQAVATQSIAGSDQLNTLLAQIYTAAGASTADPSSLFETDDTDAVGAYNGTTVPQDVATVCQWTVCMHFTGKHPAERPGLCPIGRGVRAGHRRRVGQHHGPAAGISQDRLLRPD